MPTSAGLALLALLRRIGSFVHTLKSLILRCLILWPHVLRSLRRIRPLCSWTGPKDIPKKNRGRTRTSPSFPGGASGGCEGYSTICASRDPNRSGEPHIRSESTEVLHLAPIAERSQSAPHSPASSFGHSFLDPPNRWHPDRDFPGGSSSYIANADDIQLPHIPHLSAPLTFTHSRVTSTQFAGAPRRSRSPSPMPHPQAHTFPPSTTLDSTAVTLTPVHSRSPSPLRPSSPLPFPPHPFPQPRVLDSSGSTQIPDVVPIPHDTEEGYPRPDIRVSPPSRSQTTKDDSQSIINFPSPTHGIRHSRLDPSDPGSLGLLQGNAFHSNENQRLNTLAPSSNQARLGFTSQITLKSEDIPNINDSGNWFDGKTRCLGQIHSEQVSRYASKGAV